MFNQNFDIHTKMDYFTVLFHRVSDHVQRQNIPHVLLERTLAAISLENKGLANFPEPPDVRCDVTSDTK